MGYFPEILNFGKIPILSIFVKKLQMPGESVEMLLWIRLSRHYLYCFYLIKIMILIFEKALKNYSMTPGTKFYLKKVPKEHLTSGFSISIWYDYGTLVWWSKHPEIIVIGCSFTFSESTIRFIKSGQNPLKWCCLYFFFTFCSSNGFYFFLLSKYSYW